MKNTQTLNQRMLSARYILIAIFNVFGDSIIAGAVCEEFMKKWASPERRFILFCSPQLLPYLKEICPSASEIIALNKRNPFHWLRFYALLKFRYAYFDIGINPYSYSKESRKIISFTRQPIIYKPTKDDFFINLYERVRIYLELERKGDYVYQHPLPDHVERILFCPESKEARRSLTKVQLSLFLTQLHEKWPEAKITLATTPQFVIPASITPLIRRIQLKRTVQASRAFLQEIKETDLVLAVDSGPMHIAAALGKFVIALFSKAMPFTVLNATTRGCSLRDEVIASIYCEVFTCQNPHCMNDLSLKKPCTLIIPSAERTIEREQCPFLARTT